MKGRRRRKSPAARVKPFWMPILLCGVVAFGALVALATWPGFNPRHVSVSGNHRIAGREILARAAIAPHESIWLQNTHAMAARIDAIPFIATASVARRPPATVSIVVTERVPFALLRSGDAAGVVDSALRVVAPPDFDDDLAVLTIGPGANLTPGAFVVRHDATELRAAYEAMTARGVVPAQLGFDRFGGMVATLHGGLRLLLGSQNDLDQKLTLAKAILSQVIGRQRRVAAIDIRAPGTPVVVY